MKGDKPYKCEQCSSTFAYQQQIKKHLQIHAGFQSYCLKIFWKLGEKPYKCDLCPSYFSAKSTLKIHTTIHSGLLLNK